MNFWGGADFNYLCMNVFLKNILQGFLLNLRFSATDSEVSQNSCEVYGTFLVLHVSLSSKYGVIRARGIHMERTALLVYLFYWSVFSIVF